MQSFTHKIHYYLSLYKNDGNALSKVNINLHIVKTSKSGPQMLGFVLRYVSILVMYQFKKSYISPSQYLNWNMLPSFG